MSASPRTPPAGPPSDRADVGRIDFAAPATTIGTLDGDLAARLTAVAGDIALIVDRSGVIRDYSVSDPDLAREGLGGWISRSWIDTVAVDSRNKVEEMLRETPLDGVGRWRTVNHQTERGSSALAIRYMTVGAGSDGRIIAIGRDLRGAAAMQQRLLQSQQSMERDYLRLRQAESRYRLLFDLSSEAVLIVDAATQRFVEANPAAQRLIELDAATTAGAPFAAVFDVASRDMAAAMLAAAANSAASPPASVRLAGGGSGCSMTATLFRQDKASYFLVRLLPEVRLADHAVDARQMLIDVLERLPDAFVVTDESLDILAENAAFLDLAHFARREHARGQSLSRFVGRPDIDLPLLVAHLREHGSVRNFATVFRSQFDTHDEVEVSAVSVPDGEQPCYGFSIRNVGRRLRDAPPPGRDLPRSVDQLTELVGRVSLKEIVRESTDLIERLCIEAALAYTEDNRASAAEILGLSRQSLYSKLHRHGLGNLTVDD